MEWMSGEAEGTAFRHPTRAPNPAGKFGDRYERRIRRASKFFVVVDFLDADGVWGEFGAAVPAR